MDSADILGLIARSNRARTVGANADKTDTIYTLDDDPRRPAQTSRRRARFTKCQQLMGEFVRAPLPRSASRRAGRPAGSTPLRVRTVFFEAVMFPLHCYPHIVLLLPRVSFPSLP